VTTPQKSPPEGWEGILEPNEAIIWQGRPERGIGWRPSHMFTVLFGLAFSGFATIWMYMASFAGGYMWMFGLIHFTAGLGVIILPIAGPAYMRHKTWYTLTNMRAFIADITVFGRKRIKSYPISKSTKVKVKNGPLTTIHFATRTGRSKRGRYTIPIGFERLSDGEAVAKLISDMQKDTT
jgi:hypothetical protein